MRLTISNKQVKDHLEIPDFRFPVYVKQLINLANVISKGTRPRYVGQMTELIKQFQGNKYREWCSFYEERHPNAILYATTRIMETIEKMKKILNTIDENMVRRWVEDLIKNKTFAGLKFQEVILKELSEIYGEDYRLANPVEEAEGIDGYVGEQAYQIKSKFSKMSHYPKATTEGVHNIFYRKTPGGNLTIDIEEN